MRTCDFPGCGGKHKGHGWCLVHLRRVKSTGSPTGLRRAKPEFTDLERLEHKGWRVEGSGCWTWLGGCDDKGYGVVVASGGRKRGAYRVAYETWVGPVSPGHLVRHKCDNPPCINPTHLVQGTYKDNMTDKMTRGRWRGNMKITYEDALDMRWARGLGATPRNIAVAYGVDRGLVYDVLSGRSWTRDHNDPNTDQENDQTNK